MAIYGTSINDEHTSSQGEFIAMHTTGRLLTRLFCALGLIAFFTTLNSGIALASNGPAFTRTLATGSYIVQVNLFQYPPVTDQAVQVTVVPQESMLQLSGHITMLPGLGTDAVPLHASLSQLNPTSSILTGNIRMPVRGAWLIDVQLNGPRGSGEASFPIVVSAPGAIPVWLGWLIGTIPIFCLVWIAWHQQRYRRTLLLQQSQ